MIPVNIPDLSGNEAKYLTECIKTGWVSSEGPFIKKFETLFSDRVQRKYGISVCNGSAALDIAVSMLEIKSGSEVIMPAFTIISCASAIVRAGLIPVVVDCDPLTWNMSASLIEEKITSRTRAILLVHIYGLPVDMDPVLEIAKKYKLKVIEDAAQAHGLLYNGKPCGSYGDVSIFSFYPNKLVTTGEGGMVLTNDINLAERARSLRNLCFQPKKRFVHEKIGWNYRMSNLQAAVGVAQLERMDIFAKRKREIGYLYSEKLSKIQSIQLPLHNTAYSENIYWVYGLVLGKEIPFDAKNIMEKLGEYGIGTRPFFWSMHEQPVFKRMGFFENVSCPISENISRRGFYIPSGLGIKNEEIDTVVTVLKKILK